MVYCDIYELGVPNNKPISDAYAASRKYIVYLPEFSNEGLCGLGSTVLLIPVDESTQSRIENVKDYL